MVWWVPLTTKLLVLSGVVAFQCGIVGVWWLQGAPGGWPRLLHYAAEHEYAMMLHATLHLFGPPWVAALSVAAKLSLAVDGPEPTWHVLGLFPTAAAVFGIEPRTCPASWPWLHLAASLGVLLGYGCYAAACGIWALLTQLWKVCRSVAAPAQCEYAVWLVETEGSEPLKLEQCGANGTGGSVAQLTVRFRPVFGI